MTRAAPVLLLGINYAPEPVGTGPYTAGLAEALAAAGHEVTVVAGHPYYPQWKRTDGYGPFWQRSSENGVEVIRCPHYVPRRPSGLRRIVHLASFAGAAFGPMVSSALRQRPQVVIVVAPALLSVPVAWFAARLIGAKLWIHVQDFEVDAAVATGLVGGGGPLLRLAQWFERTLLSSADRVSTISPQMCARLALKGVAPDAIVEARNWANLAYAKPSGTGCDYRAQWGLSDRQVVLYSGNIANKQGIEIIIEAARLVRHRRDIVFVICGEGPNRANLARLAETLDNVQLHDLQPTERVGDLLALASVHLLPQIPGAADLVLPSKLANMLGSGRPVVATAALGTGIAVEVEGAGLVTPPGDAPALAEAVVYLIDNPEVARRLGDEGRQRSLERWSKSALLDRMVEGIAQAARTLR
ncbi:WcaI family glycosyltransferase [Novosphingobium huizhouense]|uniref:WcaI family glycosyltransferase n=1 Tax=Novosphingobium huizhouense TaxID=2866625 RepID=UPI001CD8FBAE|nr:WcaI family glycosyltransferase [Novosphingobium huizhouense]